MKLMWKLMVNTVLILMLGFQSGISHAGLSPDDLVKQTAEDVLNIVRTDKEIQAGNQQKIFALAEEKILPNFDFDRVCRMVLGKNWRKATDVQKQDFQKEFRSLLLRTYSSALGKYRNQEIVYKKAQYSKDKTMAKVKTEIIQDSGPSVEVDYSLKQTSDHWKVFDISVAKISLVTNYRSQFSGEIRNNGIDSLIKKLAAKNAQAGIK